MLDTLLLVMLAGPGDNRSRRTASFLAAASYRAPLDRYWLACLDVEDKEGEVWWSAVWERDGFKLPGTGVRPLDRCCSFASAVPTSTRLERDLARWMLSTVGGAMCLPPLTLCLANNFLCPCGDLAVIMFLPHKILVSHAAGLFPTCPE